LQKRPDAQSSFLEHLFAPFLFFDSSQFCLSTPSSEHAGLSPLEFNLDEFTIKKKKNKKEIARIFEVVIIILFIQKNLLKYMR
jgi:hypothetical protein